MKYLALVGCVGLAVWGPMAMGAVPACGSSTNEFNVLSGGPGRCVNNKGGSMKAEGSTGTCCSNPTSGLPGVAAITYGEQPCKVVEMGDAFCEDPDNCPVGADDKMYLTIDTDAVTKSDDCCKDCLCYGDPQCRNFDGLKDDWILCDARTPALDECDHSPGICAQKVDHNGNTCRWIRGTDMWNGWEESGSPCQPDWSQPNFEWPTMVMHKRDAFELVLTLGERGIITKVDLTTSEGSFELTSDRCMSEGANAWTGDAVPSSWSREEVNGYKIVWNVLDGTLGIQVEISCLLFGEGRTRIDVDRLIETQADNLREDMEGFCGSGLIGDKAGTAENTGYEFCILEGLPRLRKACDLITGKPCKRLKKDIKTWCQSADLSAVPRVQNSVKQCVKQLLRGDDKQKRDTWIEFICTMNGVELSKCYADIAQFGLRNFFLTYSNSSSVDPNYLSHIDNVVPAHKCTAKASTTTLQSTDFMVDTDPCRVGIDVEYLKDGKWEQSFHIPQDYPICRMMVDGATNPELFKYPIRLAQQCNKASCAADANAVRGMCQPLQGFEAEVEFKGSCKTPAPTDPPVEQVPGPSPTLPPISCDAVELDLIFVVDESNSIGPFQWTKLLTFVNEVTEELSISATETRLAYITFSSAVRTHVEFTDPESIEKLQFLDIVNGVKQARRDTATPQALQTAMDMWDVTPKRTAETQRMVVMLTDGQPHQAQTKQFCQTRYQTKDQRKCARKQATILTEDQGSKFVYVPIGKDSWADLYGDIPDYIFDPSNFDELLTYIQALLYALCPP